MLFQFKSRFTGLVQAEVEVTVKSDDSDRVKLGKAIKEALKQAKNLQGAYLQGAYLQGAYLQGADLQGAYLQGAYLQGAYLQGAYLQGADLQGADLRGAYLQGTYLQGADLQGAYLQGADLRDAKIISLIARADRNDGYSFYCFRKEDGGVIVSAGCRLFTIEEYRAHIQNEYPATGKAKETSDILDFFEKRST